MAPTFDTIRQESDDRSLIRKIQKAIILIRVSTAALPTTLFTTGGALVDFKAAGWLPAGMITPDGIEYERDVSEEDVQALGYTGTVRTDVTEVARSVTFTPLEYGRKHMLELAYGTDLAAVTQTSADGEVVFDEPEMPINQEYQMLVLGIDGPATKQWILGRAYGAVKLSSTGSQTWATSDPMTSQLTLKVLTDAITGVPLRHFMGGTGAKAAATKLGFTQAPPAIPTITSVLPSGATTGQQVTIKGTGFTGATAVAFGAVNAPTFTVVDSTTIVVTVPSSTAGTVLVTVTNATGTSTGFSYTRGA